MGGIIYSSLKKINKNILVIDHNPEVIREMVNKKQSCLYGDISNLDILEKIQLRKVKIIISTVSNKEENLILLDYAKSIKPSIKVILMANHVHEAEELYEYGADYVILPHLLGGEKLSAILKKSLKNPSYQKELRKKHIDYLGKIDPAMRKRYSSHKHSHYYLKF